MDLHPNRHRNTVAITTKIPKGQAKRERILATAAQLFSEKGYSATTLGDIAGRAGTHPGSLYYHFESREAIVREVLKASMHLTSERVEFAINQLPKTASWIDRITVGIRVHLHNTLTSDPYMSAYNRIINEVPAAIREEFKAYPREYGKYWQSLITSAQLAGEIKPALDPSLLRMLLFGSITSTQIWFNPSGRRSREELAQHLIEVFLIGILPVKN